MACELLNGTHYLDKTQETEGTCIWTKREPETAEIGDPDHQYTIQVELTPFEIIGWIHISDTNPDSPENWCNPVNLGGQIWGGANEVHWFSPAHGAWDCMNLNESVAFDYDESECTDTSRKCGCDGSGASFTVSS
jgi:hypothetical protein